MAVRFSHLFSSRARSRPSPAARTRRKGPHCDACGAELIAHDHAIQLSAGTFHAGCVLYRPRVAPAAPMTAEQRLQATR